MWSNRHISSFMSAVAIVAGTSSSLADENLLWHHSATLSGFQEVQTRVTPAKGSCKLFVAKEMIRFKMEYSGFATPVSMAHLHLGARGVNGGVIAYLCGGDGKPACPQTGGMLEGEITAKDIQAIKEQGLEARDLMAVKQALRAGVVYVNVHSEAFPEGEIRGQISTARRR